MLTLVEENYLKTILTLSDKEGKVLVKALSRELDVKMPTVNSMMKRLSEKGYIHFENYKPIFLTERGRKEAASILRKHRLTETFLYEKMELGWEQVHAIAEQIEHIRSDLFFDKMDQMLNHPKVDPHGEPIPSKNGDILESTYRKLSVFEPGDVVVFMAVNDASDTFLEYLNKRNLSLGIGLEIISKEEYDGSMAVRYGGSKKEEVLSRPVCDKILVEKNKLRDAYRV